MIKNCVCDHEYQDEKYGYKKRVHNLGRPNNGSAEARCTVCGRTEIVSLKKKEEK